MAGKLTLNKSLLSIFILAPATIYLSYMFLKENLIGFLTVSLSSILLIIFFSYFFKKKRPPRRIDERIVTFLLHMYAISQGEVGPDDLVRAVAETEDYGYYSTVFKKIRELARKFGYGFTKAVSQVADAMKPPLKDILVRCTEIFSNPNPRGYLELEASMIFEEYSSYYFGAIEALKVLGGIFSTFQSVAIFVIVTMNILTVFMDNPNTIYFAYAISICILLVMYLGIRAVVPKDIIIYIDRRDPPRLYTLFRLTLPLAIAGLAPAMIIYMRYGPPYAMLALGSILIIPGWIAQKLEGFVYKADEHYPTFIKSLGENMASTLSLKSALNYSLRMEIGPLKSFIKRALARIKIGISNEKTLDMLASEIASHRIHMANKIFIDAVNYGGNPLVVGKILGNSIIKFLEFRKRRLSVAKSIEAIIVLLQPLTVSLLIILAFLSRYFSKGLSSLPYLSLGEIPLPIIEAGNIIIILFVTFINALAIREVKGGFWGKFLLYAGELLILSGAAWIGAGMLMNFAFGELMSSFKEMF